MSYPWENSTTLNESFAINEADDNTTKKVMDYLKTKDEFKDLSDEALTSLWTYYYKVNELRYNQRNKVNPEDVYNFLTVDGSCTLTDIMLEAGENLPISSLVEIGLKDPKLMEVIKKLEVACKIIDNDFNDLTVPEDEGDKHHHEHTRKLQGADLITSYFRDIPRSSSVQDCIDLLADAYYHDDFDYENFKFPMTKKNVKESVDDETDEIASSEETSEPADTVNDSENIGAAAVTRDIINNYWKIINDLKALKVSINDEDNQEIIDAVIDDSTVNVGMLESIAASFEENTQELLDSGKTKAEEITEEPKTEPGEKPTEENK